MLIGLLPAPCGTRQQDLPRSFLSPVGVPGAAVSIVLMILSLLIGTIFTPWGM